MQNDNNSKIMGELVEKSLKHNLSSKKIKKLYRQAIEEYWDKHITLEQLSDICNILLGQENVKEIYDSELYSNIDIIADLRWVMENDKTIGYKTHLRENREWIEELYKTFKK